MFLVCVRSSNNIIKSFWKVICIQILNNFIMWNEQVFQPIKLYNHTHKKKLELSEHSVKHKYLFATMTNQQHLQRKKWKFHNGDTRLTIILILTSCLSYSEDWTPARLYISPESKIKSWWVTWLLKLYDFPSSSLLVSFNVLWSVNC